MTETSPPVEASKSQSLFHYTTAQGLLGIVRDRSLFATHANFSNDSSECRLVLPYLTKILAAEYEQHYPRLVALGVLDQDLLRDHGHGIFAKEALTSVNAMLTATNNTAPYFITSFCIHDEESYEYSNGLLSQWRSYAVGGFAIEFDELEIDELNKEENAGWRYQGIITNTVAYEDHETRVKPEQFEGMAGSFLRTVILSKEAGRPQIITMRRRSELNRILELQRLNILLVPSFRLLRF